MLRWAVRSRLIGFNPLECVTPLPMGRAYEKRPRRALTAEEAAALLGKAEEYDASLAAYRAAEQTIAGGTKGAAFAGADRRPHVPQAPLFRAFLFTGARFGELTRATWGDLDAPAALLTLRASTTKSRKQRTIPLRAEVLSDLDRLRHVHGLLRERPPTEAEPIFLSPKGLPWGGNASNALHLLEDILKAAGIPKRDAHGRSVCLHALRHSTASLMARAGVPLLQAQHLLGHSDPKLTAAIYTHLSGNDLRGAVEAMPSLTVSAEKRQERQAAGAEVGAQVGNKRATGTDDTPATPPNRNAATSHEGKRLRRNSPSRTRTYNQAVNRAGPKKNRRAKRGRRATETPEIPEENAPPPSDAGPTPEHGTP